MKDSISRLLIIVGTFIILIGLFWPWLKKLPIGHLPGDFIIKRGGFTFYFPLTTCIIISVILMLIFLIFKR